MPIVLRSLLIALMFLSLTSATTTKPIVQKGESVIVVEPVQANKKLNFFDRLLLKLFTKKIKADTERGDNQAETSLALGLAAFLMIGIGLFVPYIFLAAIPLGIIAITTGSAALRYGTKKEGAARTGKGLGIGALATVLAILLIVTIFIAAWGFRH